MEVFVVQHEYEWCERDEIKFIGVFATQKEAESIVERLLEQPGFKNWPEGFHVERWELGKHSWESGFSTMVPICIRLLGDNQEFQTATGEWHPGEIYRICSMSDAPLGLVSEFGVGDIVRCVETEGRILAVELYDGEV